MYVQFFEVFWLGLPYETLKAEGEHKRNEWHSYTIVYWKVVLKIVYTMHIECSW
jgi:hypothetical protein